MNTTSTQTIFDPKLAIVMFLTFAAIVIQGWFGDSGHGLSGHSLGSDDAYISYRYAHNFFNGNGLVFNPGDHVEGYSNFLYTLLIVPVFFISSSLVYQYSVLLNALLISITIYFFYRHLNLKFGKNNALLGAILFGLNPWIWVNSATGLETALIIAITTWAWLILESYIESPTSSNFLALAAISFISILSRVDGFILPTMIAAYLFFKGNFKTSLKLFFIIFLIAIIYTICRYFYYDDIIANTFYNKVSGNLFARIKVGYTDLKLESWRSGLWVPILAIILGIAWLTWQNLVDWYLNTHKFTYNYFANLISFPAFYITVWCLYFVYIGGDIYYERFVVPLIPLGIFVLWSIFSKFNLKLSWLLLFFCLFLLNFYTTLPDDRFALRKNKYDMWVNYGKFLKANYPKSTLIAVDAAGKIPYFSEMKTLDMYGLNEKAIGKMKLDTTGFALPGHAKFDAAYILSKHPEIISTWIQPNLDMNCGLLRSIYSKDYKLKYLINPTRIDKGDNNIIDVSAMSESQIKSLVRDNSYAVLIRK